MNKLTKAILIALILIIADQILKIWVKTHMTIGESYVIFGEWSKIYFTENKGMAFGMEFGGNTGKLILSILRLLAIGGIIWYMIDIAKKNFPTITLVSLAFILAGATGNIIDSAIYGLIFSSSSFYEIATFLPEGGGYTSFLHGSVVDMLYFPLVRGTFPEWIPFWGGTDFEFFRPIFNIADSCITIGVVMLFIFRKKFLNLTTEVQ